MTYRGMLLAVAAATLGLASAPARADLLLDFRSGVVETGRPLVPDPFFTYDVFTPTLGSNVLFSAPLVPGANVFELSGEPLAITVAALTDGSLQAAYGFSFGHGDTLEFGIGYRDEFDFFVGQATDLQGYDVDAVRITWDVCLQPTGAEGCASIFPGQIGYAYDLSFQAFGSRAMDVPEPASLAALGAGLLLLATTRRRRSLRN